MARELKQQITNIGTTENPSLWTWKQVISEYLDDDAVETNTSVVNVKSYLGRTSTSSSYFQGTANVEIECDSKKRTINNKTFPYTSVAKNGWVLIQDETFDVEHDSDGSKTIDVISIMSDAIFNPTSASANGTMTLTQLHKVPELNSVQVIETSNVLISAGISNNVFVSNLSKKQFNISATLYDDAVVSKYKVSNSLFSIESSTNNFPIDFSNKQLEIISPTTTKLTYTVIDSKNGSASGSLIYTLIPYFKPSFINTSTIVRRNGQTSGKAVLSTTGNIYYQSVGNVSPSIRIDYKYWKKGDQEPSTYNHQVTINVNQDINISNNTFTINNFQLGTDFDFRYSYYVKLKITDSFSTSEELVKSIPVGKATWSEYIDHVDFEKITIKQQKINDFVVEQGVEGIWTYRKWNSGIAECWGFYNVQTAINSQWNNLYTAPANTFDRQDYPFEFIEVPNEQVNLKTSQSAAWIYSESGNSGNTISQTGKYNVARTSSIATDNDLTMVFFVIGKWK